MNRLKEIIEKLKAIDAPFCGATFYPPATDEEISAFEEEHNLTIPESYKKWLRLTNGARLEGGTITMFGVNTPKLCSVNETIFYDNNGNILEDKEQSDYIILAEWSPFSFIGCRKDNGKLVFLNYGYISGGLSPESMLCDDLADILEEFLELPEL